MDRRLDGCLHGWQQVITDSTTGKSAVESAINVLNAFYGTTAGFVQVKKVSKQENARNKAVRGMLELGCMQDASQATVAKINPVWGTSFLLITGMVR